MNNNMMSFFMNMVRSGGNPEAMLIQMLQQQNTPMSSNILNMAKRKDTAGLEQLARNLCQQRGIDFDSEFKVFKEQLGFK